MNREVREASAAGATWRTMVRALHRTSLVVSLHLLTVTLMRRTTRPFARAILLRKRLCGKLLTGNTISSSSKRSRADQ